MVEFTTSSCTDIRSGSFSHEVAGLVDAVARKPGRF
jgi:hypothetical protein